MYKLSTLIKLGYKKKIKEDDYETFQDSQITQLHQNRANSNINSISSNITKRVSYLGIYQMQDQIEEAEIKIAIL